MEFIWFGSHDSDHGNAQGLVTTEQKDWESSRERTRENLKKKTASERIQKALEIAHRKQNKLSKWEKGPGGYKKAAIDTFAKGIRQVDGDMDEIANIHEELHPTDLVVNEDIENMISQIPGDANIEEIKAVMKNVMKGVIQDSDAYQVFDAIMGTLAVANSALGSLTMNIPFTIYKAGKEIDTMHQNQKLLFGAIDKAWTIFIQGDMLLRYLYANPHIRFCKKPGLLGGCSNFRSALDQALLNLSNVLKENTRVDKRIMASSITQLNDMFGSSRVSIHDTSDTTTIRKIQIKRWLEKQQVFDIKQSALVVVVNRFLMYTYVDGVLPNQRHEERDKLVNRSASDYDQAKSFVKIWKEQQKMYVEELVQLYAHDINDHILWLRKKWKLGSTSTLVEPGLVDGILEELQNKRRATIPGIFKGGKMDGPQKTQLKKWYTKMKEFKTTHADLRLASKHLPPRQGDPALEDADLQFKIDVNLIYTKMAHTAQSYKQLELVTKEPWKIDYFNFDKIGNVKVEVFKIVNDLIVEANIYVKAIRKNESLHQISDLAIVVIEALHEALHEYDRILNRVRTRKLNFSGILLEQCTMVKKQWSNVVKAFVLLIKSEASKVLRPKYPNYPKYQELLQESCLHAFAVIVTKQAVAYRTRIRKKMIIQTQANLTHPSLKYLQRKALENELNKLENETDKTEYDIKKRLGIDRPTDLGIKYPHLVILDDISDIKEKMSIIISEHFDDLLIENRHRVVPRITPDNIEIMKRGPHGVDKNQNQNNQANLATDKTQRGYYLRYKSYPEKETNALHIRDKASNLLIEEDPKEFDLAFEGIIDSQLETDTVGGLFTEMCQNLIFSDEKKKFINMYKLLFKIWRYVIQPYSYLFFGSSFLPVWNQEFYDFGNTIYHCFNSGLNKRTVENLYMQIVLQLRFKVPGNKIKKWGEVLSYLEEMSTSIQERQKTEELAGKGWWGLRKLKRKLWRVYTRSDPALITRQINSKVTAVNILKNELNTQMVIGENKSNLQDYCKSIPFIPDLSRTPDSRDKISSYQVGGINKFPMYKLHSNPQHNNPTKPTKSPSHRFSKSPVHNSIYKSHSSPQHNNPRKPMNKPSHRISKSPVHNAMQKSNSSLHHNEPTKPMNKQPHRISKSPVHNISQDGKLISKLLIHNHKKNQAFYGGAKRGDELETENEINEEDQKIQQIFDMAVPNWFDRKSSSACVKAERCKQKEVSQIHGQIQQAITERESKRQEFTKFQKYEKNTWPSYYASHRGFIEGTYPQQVKKTLSDMKTYSDFFNLTFVILQKINVFSMLHEIKNQQRENDHGAAKKISAMIYTIIANVDKHVKIEDKFLYNGQRGMYDKPPQSFLMINDMFDWLENDTGSDRQSLRSDVSCDDVARDCDATLKSPQTGRKKIEDLNNWMNNKTPGISQHGMNRNEGKRMFVANLWKLIEPPENNFVSDINSTMAILEHYLSYIQRSWIIQFGLLKYTTNILENSQLKSFLVQIYDKMKKFAIYSINIEAHQQVINHDDSTMVTIKHDDPFQADIDVLIEYEKNYFDHIQVLEDENSSLEDAHLKEFTISIDEFKEIKDMFGKYPAFNLTGNHNQFRVSLRRMALVEKDMEFLDIKRTYLSERLALVHENGKVHPIYPWIPSGGVYRASDPLDAIFPTSPWDDTAIYSSFSNHHIDDEFFYSLMNDDDDEDIDSRYKKIMDLWHSGIDGLLKNLKEMQAVGTKMQAEAEANYAMWL